MLDQPLSPDVDPESPVCVCVCVIVWTVVRVVTGEFWLFAARSFRLAVCLLRNVVASHAASGGHTLALHGDSL